MSFPILGLHHVTATVDDAQADLNFASASLALRVVKKTVNFDNHGVYHFYYGDERGTPGTIWTTFPYRGMGVPIGLKGAGQVTTTAFSVPTDSLSFWKARLRDRGFSLHEAPPRFGEEALEVVDPSGLSIELVGTAHDTRTPWIGRDSGVEASAAIRGLHSVTMTLRDLEGTIQFMRDLLGFEIHDQSDNRTRVTVNGARPGHFIDLLHVPDARAAKNGLGTVHHVAMAIANPDDQMRLRKELIGRGIQVTPLMDRQYFQSIYFREPGGVLFEVATMSPGFTVDEPIAELGRALKLPPEAEAHRSEIQKQLPPVQYQ